MENIVDRYYKEHKRRPSVKVSKEKSNVDAVQLNLKVSNCNLFFIAENERKFRFCELLIFFGFFLFIYYEFG